MSHQRHDVHATFHKNRLSCYIIITFVLTDVSGQGVLKIS
jgi:hypothetical protein